MQTNFVKIRMSLSSRIEDNELEIEISLQRQR